MAVPASAPSTFLQLVSHDLRWRMVSALARSDRRVQELVELVGEPPNLVSYHLRRLRSHRLVAEHRSAADRRDVYYRLDLERLRDLYVAAGAALHPMLALGASATRGADQPGAAAGSPVRVLFLCTHNSARSQMAEALLRRMGGNAVDVRSAGTIATRVHPLAVRVMQEHDVSLDGHRSKHLDELLNERFDYVITVCDGAREACPVFPGARHQLHWSIADPSAVTGNTAAKLRAFRTAAEDIERRVGHLLALLQSEAR